MGKKKKASPTPASTSSPIPAQLNVWHSPAPQSTAKPTNNNAWSKSTNTKQCDTKPNTLQSNVNVIPKFVCGCEGRHKGLVSSTKDACSRYGRSTGPRMLCPPLGLQHYLRDDIKCGVGDTLSADNQAERHLVIPDVAVCTSFIDFLLNDSVTDIILTQTVTSEACFFSSSRGCNFS